MDGQLSVSLKGGSTTGLKTVSQFAGYTGGTDAPTSVLLRNNELHFEIVIDRDHAIGKDDAAGVADVMVEAALTSIMDFEDSVAAVDAEDKVLAYRNWLGLTKGDLADTFMKGGREVTRRLKPDTLFTAPDGGDVRLHGRSLMLVRNVGLLMTNAAILYDDGKEIPECLMDGVFNAAIGLHDLRGANKGGNSRAGSIYMVSPKMHGPEEVASSKRSSPKRKSCSA